MHGQTTEPGIHIISLVSIIIDDGVVGRGKEEIIFILEKKTELKIKNLSSPPHHEEIHKGVCLAIFFFRSFISSSPASLTGLFCLFFVFIKGGQKGQIPIRKHRIGAKI